MHIWVVNEITSYPLSRLYRMVDPSEPLGNIFNLRKPNKKPQKEGA